MFYDNILFGKSALAGVTRRYGWTIPVIVILGLLGTALEGLGIGLLIPLLETLNQSDSASDRGGLAQFLSQIGAGLDPGTRLVVISGAILLLIVCKEMVVYAGRVFVAWVYGKAGHDLRVGMAERLYTVGYPFFVLEQPGRLVNIMMHESWVATEAIQQAFETVTNISAVFIFLVFLLLLSWEMTLVVAAGLLIVQAVQTLLAARLGPLSERVTAEDGVLAARTLDAIQATRLVRLFGQEAREHQRFAQASEKVRAAAFRVERSRWKIQPSVEVLHILLFLAVLLGAYRAGVAFSLVAAFIVLLYRLQPHVRTMQTTFALLRSRSGSLKSVDWLLDPDDKPLPPQGDQPFPGLQSVVEFKNVSFRYPGPDRPAVLDAASFELRKGRSIALIGRSGSGKTTVVNLICRFFEPTEGAILVDGVPLNRIDPRRWRSVIALASQDLELVDGTIAENIAYGAPDASPEAIATAARAADAHDFIASLPEGYDTMAGQRGMSFSAGQRQRIALARALVRNPEILILDEATNAVDGLSEATIFEALRDRAGQRTTIVISHRKSTLAFCDDAVVVQGGRVTATGPLSNLNVLERDDLYD